MRQTTEEFSGVTHSGCRLGPPYLLSSELLSSVVLIVADKHVRMFGLLDSKRRTIIWSDVLRGMITCVHGWCMYMCITATWCDAPNRVIILYTNTNLGMPSLTFDSSQKIPCLSGGGVTSSMNTSKTSPWVVRWDFSTKDWGWTSFDAQMMPVHCWIWQAKLSRSNCNIVNGVHFSWELCLNNVHQICREMERYPTRLWNDLVANMA